MKIFYFSILSVLIQILLHSCKKDDTAKYCETNSIHKPYAENYGIVYNGRHNKITFKIDGKPFSMNCSDLPNTNHFGISYTILPQYNGEILKIFSLFIQIPNYPVQNQIFDLRIRLHKTMVPGIYQLEHEFLPEDRENKTRLILRNDTTYPNYYVQRRSYGWLDLEVFDSVTLKASGRFEFDLVNDKNYSDTIKIREGVFDGGFTLIR